MPSVTVDEFTKRLLRAAAPDLQRSLGVRRLNRELLGEIYLRLREVLGRFEGPLRQEALRQADIVDELALTIYMVASTYDPGRQPSPELLSPLARALDGALSELNSLTGAENSINPARGEIS